MKIKLSQKFSKRKFLCAESVESSSLSLESIDDVHSSDGLSLGMLGVGDGISDDASEEVRKDRADGLVDQLRDSLDSSSAGESSDRGLGNALDQGARAALLGSLVRSLSGSLASLSSFTDGSHYLLSQTSDLY